MKTTAPIGILIFLASLSIAQAAPNGDEVLEKLLAGNARFAEGKTLSPRRAPEDFRPLAEGQSPVAVIVACSDSRVAPELMFDMGVGDLFVIRVAGNVVTGTGVVLKGSIEYGVGVLGTPLVIVLGHSECGAVKAAVEHTGEKDSLPGSIEGLVELLRPAVVEAERGDHGDQGHIVAASARENVRIGVERLKEQDPILAPAVKEGRVKIVGGIYDLATGKVEILEP